MKKKLLLTSLVIFIGILLFGVLNASAATEGYFTYTVSNGETTITKCDKSASGIVTIPDILGGYPVTVVDSQTFYDCDDITGVVFGKNVKSIGSYVTLGCDNITSISMTDSVTSIGQYAFSGLKISYIILSENITSMGSGVLSNCKNLIWTVLPEKITVLQTNTFSQCTSLQKVFVPKTVTSISYYAFQNCNNLTDVYFSGSQTQWNNISMTSDNMSLSSLKSATIHYNTPARYTVSFNANGGSNAPVSITKIYGISSYLPSTKPSRYGYAFKNWNTRTNGTGTSYNSGGIYSENASVTLYAQWSANRYTVNYYSNDAKNLLLATSYHDYGVSRQLVKMGYKRDGYNFRGWSTSKNSTTVTYTDEESVLNLTATNGGVINLYAVWELAEYTVAYDANGGENVPAAHTTSAFTDVVLSSDIPTREGYVFEGWSEDSESNVAQYQPGDVISVESSDITLYAVWRDYVVIDSGTLVNKWDEEKIITWKLYENGKLTLEGTGAMYFSSYDASAVPWNKYKNEIISVEVSDGITDIGYAAFENHINLTSVSLPDSITSINQWAFNGCKSLSGDINLKNVRSIGVCAFSDCENIGNVLFSEELTFIGNGAFLSCTGLTSVYIPESVTQIGLTVFGHCKNLLEIEVSENNPNYASIDGVLFNKAITTLKEYPLGKKGDYIIPETVVEVEEMAFMGSDNLTGITIPGSVKTINYSTFDSCTNLERVTIGDGVEKIKSNAFYKCNNIENIIIPNSVTTIEKEAFLCCSAAKTITIGENVTTIGTSAFASCTSVEELYWNAINVGDFTDETLAFNNLGCDTKGLTLVFGDKVKKIPEYVFFYPNKIASLNIGSSVEIIGAYAFRNCDEIVGELIIPNKVASIGEYAFYGCNGLTSITIPKSLTNIGKKAFSYCNNLETTYYWGNEKQWNNINIGEGNEPLIKNVVPAKRTKTTVSEDGKTFIVNLINIDVGKTVIVALYNGDRFVEIQTAVYAGEELTFTTKEEYDATKIMVWEDLTDFIPVTEPEII